MITAYSIPPQLIPRAAQQHSVPFCPEAAEHEDLNLAWVREQFPILQNNVDKIFFDNASTTHKPESVLKAINNFNSSICGNAGRGSYSWSTRLSRAVEESRAKLAGFLNADPHLLAFTQGATDSLNFVASAWGLHNLRDGDEVMLCPGDHQSAILPWYNLQILLARFDISIKIIPFNIHPTGTYDRASLSRALSRRTRVIAMSHIHHVYGMEMDLSEVKKLIPDEVFVSLDVSQSIGHIPIDARALAVDFISFSGHKMFASNGTGALLTSERALAQLWPSKVGAKTKLKKTDTQWQLNNACLANIAECGTPNLPGILSLAAAVDFMSSISMSRLQTHVSELTKYLAARLKQIPFVEFAPGIGVCDCTRGYGIVSFQFAGANSADIGALLDSEGIYVRTGDHCQGIDEYKSEYIRVSLQVYNTQSEVDRLIEVLTDALC